MLEYYHLLNHEEESFLLHSDTAGWYIYHSVTRSEDKRKRDEKEKSLRSESLFHNESMRAGDQPFISHLYPLVSF
jgi:hypothetical protein